jgi:hypothetical protein
MICHSCGGRRNPYVPDRDTPCATCGKWTHRLTPGGAGIVYCSKSCEEGIEPGRDTMCAGCYKWTHILTPGGRGTVYCGGCKARGRGQYY